MNVTCCAPSMTQPLQTALDVTFSSTSFLGTFLVDGENQRTNASSYALAYDADGNPTGPVFGSVSATLGYDDENRLTNLSYGGNTYAFAYDGPGRLRTRNDAGAVVNYIYDGMRVIQERDGTNGPQGTCTQRRHLPPAGCATWRDLEDVSRFTSRRSRRKVYYARFIMLLTCWGIVGNSK